MSQGLEWYESYKGMRFEFAFTTGTIPEAN